MLDVLLRNYIQEAVSVQMKEQTQGQIQEWILEHQLDFFFSFERYSSQHPQILRTRTVTINCFII